MKIKICKEGRWMLFGRFVFSHVNIVHGTARLRNACIHMKMHDTAWWYTMQWTHADVRLSTKCMQVSACVCVHVKYMDMGHVQRHTDYCGHLHKKYASANVCSIWDMFDFCILRHVGPCDAMHNVKAVICFHVFKLRLVATHSWWCMLTVIYCCVQLVPIHVFPHGIVRSRTEMCSMSGVLVFVQCVQNYTYS